MRLLTQPKNTEQRVAATALTYGQFVYINSDGKFAAPTDASTAAKAVYVIVRPAEMSRAFTGYDNTVKAGELCQGVNGCKVRFFSESLNIPTDNFATCAPGTKLGITNSGLVALTASAAANTTGFLILDSFTGTGATASGILDASIDYMI